MLSWEYNRACFFALEENGPKRIKITYDGRVFFGHQQLGRFPSLRTFEKGEGMTFALPDVHARRPPMLPQTVALPDLR
jgi:hypothetical protein